MMIIKSLYPHKVGELVTGGSVNDHNGNPHSIPFLIMEVVTKEDYIKECIDENISVGIIYSKDNFYRISID